MFCGTKILAVRDGPQVLPCPRCGERYHVDVRQGRPLLTKLTDRQDCRLADGLAGCQRFGAALLVLLVVLCITWFVATK